MSQIPPGMLLRIINNKEDIIAAYTQLALIAPVANERAMIDSILFDEKAHLKMFSDLYKSLFGESPALTGGNASIPLSYLEGLNSAMMSEFNTYSVYGNIFFTDSEKATRDVFLRAVFDENIHSTKFNYILGKLLTDGTVKML